MLPAIVVFVDVKIVFAAKTRHDFGVGHFAAPLSWGRRADRAARGVGDFAKSSVSPSALATAYASLWRELSTVWHPIATTSSARSTASFRKAARDRKSHGTGKSVSVGVDLGGSRIIKKKKKK